MWTTCGSSSASSGREVLLNRDGDGCAAHATDLQQAMQIQSEFLRSQFTNAGEHMRNISGGVMTAAKDATKVKID